MNQFHPMTNYSVSLAKGAELPKDAESNDSDSVQVDNDKSYDGNGIRTAGQIFERTTLIFAILLFILNLFDLL
jgi:hypothetical protein